MKEIKVDEKLKLIIAFLSKKNYPDLYASDIMKLIEYISNQFPEKKIELTKLYCRFEEKFRI